MAHSGVSGAFGKAVGQGWQNRTGNPSWNNAPEAPDMPSKEHWCSPSEWDGSVQLRISVSEDGTP